MCVLFGIFYFFVQIYFSFPSVYALCVIVKQRIDSGFFLCNTKADSSDDDFV